MPTNANTFNSRVTSEALETKFRQVFPAQGGAELVQDLFASGVIQPVVDFSSVAEGSVLPTYLQTALDFAVTANQTSGATTGKSIITNPGFWRCDIFAGISASTSDGLVNYYITDGITDKTVFYFQSNSIGSTDLENTTVQSLIIFLRAGDSLELTTGNTYTRTNISYRQVATVSGELINPFGFTSS